MRALLVIPVLLGPLAAAEKITYDDHIFPILEAHCLNCHNPDKKKGGLDLSTYQGTMAGGSGGKITITGDGASSRIFSVTIHTEEPVMPPEGDKLEKKNTDLIREWIDGGLLETQSSRVKKPKKPAFSLTAVENPQTKPEGPPPMPKDLLRDPVVVTSRSTVVNDMAASPWAPLLAITAQKQVLLYHTETLTLIGVLPFPYGNPESLSFHPNGKYLIAGGGIGGKSGTTIVWDITTGKPILQMGREFDSVLAADLHPDLKSLALGGPSRILKIWDTQKSEQIHRIKKHTDWITALRYSPNGKLLATGDRNHGIQIWEGDTANEFHTLGGHQSSIVELKWRPDSKVVASASSDGQLILWDAKRGKQIKKTKAHEGGVLAMDYCRHGLVVTSGRDNKVKFWKHDLTFKRELPVFDSQITEVEFGHDGKRFFTSNWQGEILAWTIKGFSQIGQLASNPPSIATRLTSLQQELTRIELGLSQKKAAQLNQEKRLTEAKTHLAKTEKEIATTGPKIAALKKKRDAGQHKSDEHEAQLSKLHTQLQALSREIKLDHDHLNTLEEQRKAITDEALLTEHQEKIKSTRDTIDGRNIESKKIQEAQKLVYSQRDKTRKEVKQVIADSEVAKQHLTQHQRALKPARKNITKQSQHLAKLKNEHGQLNSKLNKIKMSIKEWQAADANTQLLKAKQSLSELADQKAELELQLAEATSKAHAQETLLEINGALEELSVKCKQAELEVSKLQKKAQR